ncbi:ead/Ea22-like family protein [Enterobacter hormaechei]|uniref:ead/Ea22-like family protein n=1 Tax=Enterobacter hormaechei TaxID=158836 RepID=UPI003754BFB3
MSNIDKRALREAANAANAASWGNWEPYKPHKGARGYEVKVGVKAVAQHCLKVDSVFIAAANPATVLALLDELEAAQSYAKERDEENQDLMLTIGRLRVERETSEAEMNDALCQLLPGVQYMDPPDGGNVTPLEQVSRMIADYRERIAELEAREVKLPDLKMLRDYLAEVTMREREDILVGVRLEFFRALEEAGVKVAAAGKGE